MAPLLAAADNQKYSTCTAGPVTLPQLRLLGSVRSCTASSAAVSRYVRLDQVRCSKDDAATCMGSRCSGPHMICPIQQLLLQILHTCHSTCYCVQPLCVLLAKCTLQAGQRHSRQLADCGNPQLAAHLPGRKDDSPMAGGGLNCTSSTHSALSMGLRGCESGERGNAAAGPAASTAHLLAKLAAQPPQLGYRQRRQQRRHCRGREHCLLGRLVQAAGQDGDGSREAGGMARGAALEAAPPSNKQPSQLPIYPLLTRYTAWP